MVTEIGKLVDGCSWLLHHRSIRVNFHLKNIMSEKVIPVVKAEEAEEPELVDPQTELREICSQKPDAQNLWAKFQECNDRVNSRSNTAETCEEELIDYIHTLDKCVNKDLFKRLK